MTQVWLKGIAAAASLWAATEAPAQEAQLRVVDVGNGLCVVGRVPGSNGFIYDGGYRSTQCRDAVRQLLPGRGVDLFVLSHSDADHVGEAATILGERAVRTIIHPGDDRTGQALDRARRAIAAEAAGGAREINLARDAVAPGTMFQLGAARLTFIAGWSDGRETRGPGERSLPAPERRNALSIVMRFEYGGRSVLLTGDTIGRLGGEPNNVCRYAERIMVRRSATVPIASDVLIGQHHGGDNATSNCFIRAVSPRFVVFSAGHGGHEHPRQSVADRLVAHGIEPANIFRTDRGDNEGGPEWVYGSIAGCRDRAGDDDVDLVMPLSPAQPLRIGYRVASSGC